MAHSSSQSQQDDVPSECDTMPLSQASQWSSCSSSCQPHTSVPLPSSPSPQHTPSGAPTRGSGRYSARGGTFRVANVEGDQRAQHELSECDKSGMEVEESDDDCVIDRTWEPDRGGEEELTSGEEGGGSGSSKGQRRRAGRSSRATTALGTGEASSSVGASGPKRARAKASSATSGRTSVVWEFFSTVPEDSTTAVCKLCKQKFSRGAKHTNVGTTALWNHVRRRHPIPLANRSGGMQPQQEFAPSPCLLSASLAASMGSSDRSLSLTSSSSISASPAPTPPPPLHRQSSIIECVSRKQLYATSNPTVRKLNSHLAKLLAVQSLPYHLVESAAFRELMACAQPRWKIPSRHYFSQKAIPALYSHVADNIGRSLQLSLCSTVHATVDTWSSAYGQGQYMSFTAHWVNVFSGEAALQQHGQVLLPPPRLCRAGSQARHLSASSISSPMDSLLSPTAAGHSVAPLPPSSYHMCQVKRCHAVLELICLGESSHKGERLLKYIKQQTARWLSPRQLQLGKVVSDNGTNIVAALNLGEMTHAPCMAHVINLVVQSFLKKFNGLRTVLAKARKLCNHFSHSYVARNALMDLQRQNGLPLHRMIGDVPTRWNSTLHMLERLYEQRKAVNDFVMHQPESAKIGGMCHFQIRQWQLVRDACRVLKPLEEATKFVSMDSCGLNDIIPLIFVLEKTLTLIQQGMTGEEDHLAHLAARSGAVQELRGQSRMEEEDEEEVQLQEGGEEEEDDLEEAEAVLEEQEEVDDDDDDIGRDTQSSSQRWAETERTGSLATLARMASCMLTCLRTDRRIVDIKQTDDYWIAMLLDPRYQSNMGECFPPEEREEKLRYYQAALCTKLATAFSEQMPAASVSEREATLRPPQTHPPPGANSRSRSSSSSSSSQFSLLNMMEHFFQVPRQALSIQQAQSTRLDSQVQAYLDSGLSTAHGLFPDPMDFWAGRLQQWPELTHYALSLFSCPASSVISERVFSAAGGVVTPKRTKLSSASVQNITFVKMNQAWIRPDFHTPPPEADE